MKNKIGLPEFELRNNWSFGPTWDSAGQTTHSQIIERYYKLSEDQANRLLELAEEILVWWGHHIDEDRFTEDRCKEMIAILKGDK